MFFGSTTILNMCRRELVGTSRTCSLADAMHMCKQALKGRGSQAGVLRVFTTSTRPVSRVFVCSCDNAAVPRKQNMSFESTSEAQRWRSTRMPLCVWVYLSIDSNDDPPLVFVGPLQVLRVVFMFGQGAVPPPPYALCVQHPPPLQTWTQMMQQSLWVTPPLPPFVLCKDPSSAGAPRVS